MAYNYNSYYQNNGGYYPQQYGSGVGYQQFQNAMPQQMARQQMDVQGQMNTPIQEILFVTSEEARAYVVFPNRNALLIDKTNKMAYFKSADSLGQSTMKVFKYDDFIDGANAQSPVKAKEEIDTSQFVKLEALDNFVNKEDLKMFANKDDLNGFVTQNTLDTALRQMTDSLNSQLAEIKKTINIKKTIEENIKNV